MTYTEEQIKSNVAAYETSMRGNPVQLFVGGVIGWHDDPNPVFSGDGTLYRPKPSPKLRPWTRDELPTLPFEVLHKTTGNRFTVVLAMLVNAQLGGMLSALGYDRLLEDFTLPDGSPCGTTEP